MMDCRHSFSGQIGSAPRCGEQTSVAPGGDSMPAFSESEGDNGHVIGHDGVAAPLGGDQAAVIEELVEGDDASAQSTGKMDQQVLGWTKRYGAVMSDYEQ